MQPPTNSQANSRSNFRLTAHYPLSVCRFRRDSNKCYFFSYSGADFLLGFIQPPANFQRDGRAVHDDNQGNRPNYPSTQEPLNLPPRAYRDANHTIWVRCLDLLVYDWLVAHSVIRLAGH